MRSPKENKRRRRRRKKSSTRGKPECRKNCRYTPTRRWDEKSTIVHEGYTSQENLISGYMPYNAAEGADM